MFLGFSSKINFAIEDTRDLCGRGLPRLTGKGASACSISKILNTATQPLLPNSSNLSFSSNFFRNPHQLPVCLDVLRACLPSSRGPSQSIKNHPLRLVPSPNHLTHPPTTHHVFSFECCRLTLNSINQHLHIPPSSSSLSSFTSLPPTRFTASTTPRRTSASQSLTPIELCSTANQSSPANNALISTDPQEEECQEGNSVLPDGLWCLRNW